MRALPADNHSQEGARSNDLHSSGFQFRTAALVVRGRMIFAALLPVQEVIRPSHYVRFDGWRRRSARLLPAQQALQFFADRRVHPKCLSRSCSCVCADANANGLTHAKIVFASGANPDD